ncbi:MAG: CDP-alcohol phosphatidyltransferase family protein [Bacteroidales bacterium]|nr:CDP-alcohol phosphatidyltransferase family protein [Bacteroidales bacterium]
MAFKNHIPNTITLLSMTSGIVAVYYGVKGSPEQLTYAGMFIFLAAVFDFLDGFAARLLHASSEIGIQLDSLSDLISFGLAPGFILFQMLNLSHGKPSDTLDGVNVIPFLALLVPLLSGLRLAKFNLDEEQQYSFKGLPTPALALLIASLPLIRQNLYADQGLFYMVITNTYFLLAIAVFGSMLLVSRFPMFSLKFHGFGFAQNSIKYVFMGISLVLLILLQVTAVPFIFALYLFVSLVLYLTDIQT